MSFPLSIIIIIIISWDFKKFILPVHSTEQHILDILNSSHFHKQNFQEDFET